MPTKYLVKFERGYYYHVFNRAVGDENLFYGPGDYKEFKKHIKNQLGAHGSILCYCLMPNHYHLLFHVADNQEVNVKKAIPEAIRQLEIKHAQRINFERDRKGTLFMRPYKRICVTTEGNLFRLFHYIHLNPVHHGISESYENYKWSSFSEICLGSSNIIDYEEVIELFQDLDNFRESHKIVFKLKQASPVPQDEFEK
ncbi:MAG TPA: transposase [Bacteroidales bacterium]|nr:transposase [Bacteroidales bacterium]HSA43290.1 transposase [Bacteroidales bacterium]